MKRLTLALFLCILGLGTFLRVYRIQSIPPSLSHDEAAIAYNAYSLATTGKDEYGASFPILFRSFDDYKLPGMVYSTIPFARLFGRSELTARLPSAIYGIIALIVMYYISYEATNLPTLSLIPMAALALSPWHINFSRQLFESNGATTFLMIGVYLLIRSYKKYESVIWAGLSWVISLYFYYSVRLVIPFLALTYLVTNWNTIIKQWKVTAIALGISILVFLPLGKEMFSAGGLQRISMVSVTNDPSYIERLSQYTQKIARHPTITNKILYNRRLALFVTVIENYWKNISPHNLFVTGTGTYGALYPFEIILIPIGIIAWYLLLTARVRRLFIIWTFTAFLPGAFSINQPNTLRTLVAAPALSLITGFAIIALFQRWKYSLVGILILLAFSFPTFLTAYFINNPTHNALAFADGSKQMVSYVSRHQSSYKTIYISGYYWRPYIFYLYWSGVHPQSYQQNGSREQYGSIRFTSASWDTNGIKFMDPSFNLMTLPDSSNALFILSEPEFRLHQKLLTRIDVIDGRVAKGVYVAAIISK